MSASCFFYASRLIACFFFTVKVLRRGKEVSVTAEVGRLEDGEKIVAAQSGQTPPATAPASVSVLGMTVTTLSDELRAKFSIDTDIKGAVVTEVAADGPAAERDLRDHEACLAQGAISHLGIVVQDLARIDRRGLHRDQRCQRGARRNG